ncbi:MAG: hypothetical protein FI718_08175 [SAR202 cluster bacterium]|nr:hypothetical protein [SAR202 cluster bacterium]|tara:strand:- start:528 stop:1292 length:765 start_codon:yes stop_codon:yes gene_type:complete
METLKRIYWSDTTKPGLYYYDVNDKSVHDFVIDGLVSPLGIAIDSYDEKVYWTDYGTHTVQRADINGENIETLVTDLLMPRHIALDLHDSKMYWTDSKDNLVQVANTDGTDYQILVKDIPGAGIALDIVAGKMYWADCFNAKGNYSANLDGSDIQLINKNLDLQVGVTLFNNKIFWADSSANKIQCSNFDGTNLEDVIINGNGPRCLAIDADKSHLYWTGLNTDIIYRSNLDGSQIVEVVKGFGEPRGIGLFFQ